MACTRQPITTVKNPLLDMRESELKQKSCVLDICWRWNCAQLLWYHWAVVLKGANISFSRLPKLLPNHHSKLFPICLLPIVGKIANFYGVVTSQLERSCRLNSLYRQQPAVCHKDLQGTDCSSSSSTEKPCQITGLFTRRAGNSIYHFFQTVIRNRFFLHIFYC